MMLFTRLTTGGRKHQLCLEKYVVGPTLELTILSDRSAIPCELSAIQDG